MSLIKLLFDTVVKIGSLSMTIEGYSFTLWDLTVFSFVAGVCIYVIVGIFKG